MPGVSNSRDVKLVRPLKICRIIARLNVGGPARHVVLLNRGLEERGHQTLLVHGGVGPGEASMDELAVASGLRVARVPALGPRVSVLSDLRAFLTLLRLIFRERPDVVHSHTAKAGTLGRLAATLYNATRTRARRALIVHTFHGHVFTGYFSAAASAAVRAAERCLARLTDCIIAISPAQRADIVSRFRIAPAERVEVIPLGLDLGPLLSISGSSDGARQALGLRSTDLVFGYVGRFVPVKNLVALVHAFAEFARTRAGASLLMVGDGPTRREVEQAIAVEKIADRVRLIGWTTDLSEVYAAMDVCVLSSLNEGTPVAVIEAMAAGKPVVATAVGGVGDVVEDGQTGFLVPPHDAAAFAAALDRVARDAALRDRMGERARSSVVRRFALGRLVADIERFYEVRLAAKRGTILAE